MFVTAMMADGDRISINPLMVVSITWGCGNETEDDTSYSPSIIELTTGRMIEVNHDDQINKPLFTKLVGDDWQGNIA